MRKIRNPASPYKKGKFVDKSPNYRNRIFSKVKDNPLTKTLLTIRKNIFSIENSIKSIFNIEKKDNQVRKKFNLIENNQLGNKNNIRPKAPKIMGNLINLPKTGVMGLIENFVMSTFLGWLFTTLQPFISKAGGLVPILGKVLNFFSSIITTTLNVVGSFLKFGYETKDKIDNIVKDIKIKTSNIDDQFNNTLAELKAVISGTTEVITSFLNVSFSDDELKVAKEESLNSSNSDTKITPPPTFATSLTTPNFSNTNTKKNNETPLTFSPNIPIQAASVGGRLDPKNTPITRGVREKDNVSRVRKPDIQKQASAPGRDVGGDVKVREIYGEDVTSGKPSFIPSSSFFKSETKSGYAGLLGASEELKKPNDRDILGIGNLMGSVVDVTLGQRPERRTYTQFADGLKYLVEQGISNPDDFRKLDIELMIRRVVEPKIDSAINKIRSEINKKSRATFMDPGSPGDGLDGSAFGAVSGNEYERAFLDLIAQAEGTSKSYGTVFGGAINKDLESGKLTVKEVIDLGNSSTTGSGATGRYQFMPNTLIGLVERGVLKINEKFTPEKQDQAAIALARGRGVDPSKPLTIRDMYRLGGEWASIEGGPQMRRGGAYGFRGSSQVKYSGEQALEIYNKKLEMVKTSVAVGVPSGMESKAKYLIVMSGQKGYRQVLPGESAPTDFLHHGREDMRGGLIVRDYGITPKVHGGSQLLEGEGAPVIVPFGMRAKAVVQGKHSIRFLDPNSNKTIAVYHHLDNIPSGINGKVISGGTFIGTQGGRPGTSSGYGRSSAVHVHLEATPEWHRAFIRTYAGGLKVPKKVPPVINTPPPPKLPPPTDTSQLTPLQSSGLNIKSSNNTTMPVNVSSNDPSSQSILAIQPIIIEKTVPTSTKSPPMISFSLPVVNNTSQQLSRA
jgi:muramidase (phage lysozyme)